MTATLPKPIVLPHAKPLSGGVTAGLDGIFSPRSIAVVGAAATPGTVPHDIFANLLASGFKGTLYPVAPGKQNICSVKAYRYVIDIPDAVDLAVIVFPSEVVHRALQPCGEKGIKSAIIISAGFREAGPEGVAREEQIKEICRRYGISLVGPNCLGVINTDPSVRLNASFARRMPDAGRIGFLSQSGALCTAVLDYAREKNIGFSKFISFGNRAGVSEIELLQYLHDDPQTDVILMYLEEISDGRALADAARRITRGPNAKPIFAIKSGRTAEGASAAASHTGSLAGEEAICDDVFGDAGIIRVQNIEQLFNSSILYAYQPAMPAGNRLAVVTNAGGPGVMATDAAVHAGLNVTRFADHTTGKLRASLPCTSNIKNPVDVIGDARADRYEAALGAILEDPNVDQVLVILTPQSMTDIERIARGIIDVAKGSQKPIACSFMGATDVAVGVRLLQEAHVPHYPLPEAACMALADIQRIRSWRRRPPEPPEDSTIDPAAITKVLERAPAGYLPESDALAVLRACGLPVPSFRLCKEVEEAVDFAAGAGHPVTLRVVSPDIVHKTEAGGIALDLDDADAVRRAWDDIHRSVLAASPAALIEGLLVRTMIPRGGHELIIGGKRDASFGPVIMFGLGGIYVELFRDVTFALAPIGPQLAGELVRRPRAFRLLEGLRGAPAADIPGIERCLVRASHLLSRFPRIAELDINPLIALPGDRGLAVADVRIRLGE
jgi:acetate---CoA ligase (ADP-forming)